MSYFKQPSGSLPRLKPRNTASEGMFSRRHHSALDDDPYAMGSVMKDEKVKFERFMKSKIDSEKKIEKTKAQLDAKDKKIRKKELMMLRDQKDRQHKI